MPETTTKKKKAAQTAQASAPWVALVAALAVPFFSYLESRDAARAARDKAAAARVETSKVDAHANTAFQLVVVELKRLAEDVDACHARYAELKKLVEGKPVSMTPIVTPEPVKRPPPQMVLPKNYRDVKSPDGGP